MHIMESLINTRQILTMRNELIDLQYTLLVVGDQIVHLRATLDATESAALPDTTSDELEC